ncbi:MAG TPA: hypothetical protein DCP67_05665 [Planctomycetaceae bacterium]|mgnify:FL=1|nr:hypothetical protein [Planctomycetaceae bacterium]
MRKKIYKQLGITLVEVLFAVGIIVVGLLGMAGLLAVAGSEMRKGLNADAMSTVANNASSEFDIRSMRSTSLYLRYNRASARFQGFTPGPGMSFCIDPGFIAYRTAQVPDPVNTGNTVPGIPVNPLQQNQTLLPFQGSGDYFPYSPITTDPTLNLEARMPRITLRRTVGGGPMGLLQAGELFVGHDDLSYQRNDALVAPSQIYATDASANRIKRLNLGQYTWFATVTSEITGATSTGLENDRFILSIVVLEGRDFRDTYHVGLDGEPGDAGTDDDGNTLTDDVLELGYAGSDDKYSYSLESERVVEVVITGSGISGGEVMLKAPTAAQLTLRPSDWIMLSANSSVGSIFRWYRVSYTESEVKLVADPSNGNPLYYKRNAVLEGADWNRPEWFPNQTLFYPTQATIMNDIIGVYQRPIRLENTSLY